MVSWPSDFHVLASTLCPSFGLYPDWGAFRNLIMPYTSGGGYGSNPVPIWFLFQWRQTSLSFKKLFSWEVVSLSLWLFKLSWSALLILYERKCWGATDCVSSLAGAGFSTTFWHIISPSFTLMLSPGHRSKYIPCCYGMFLLQLSRDVPKAWSASGHAPCRNKVGIGSVFVIVRLPVPQSPPSIWNFPWSPPQVQSLTWRRWQLSEFWSRGYSADDNLYVLILHLVLTFLSLRPQSPTLWLLSLSF